MKTYTITFKDSSIDEVYIQADTVTRTTIDPPSAIFIRGSESVAEFPWENIIGWRMQEEVETEHFPLKISELTPGV